uniref:Uncharacterized protein n=1 Tax=Eutreptiella gymnastica TaxID=73025 RepID=A0A7S4G7V0_9EUGL
MLLQNQVEAVAYHDNMMTWGTGEKKGGVRLKMGFQGKILNKQRDVPVIEEMGYPLRLPLLWWSVYMAEIVQIRASKQPQNWTGTGHQKKIPLVPKWPPRDRKQISELKNTTSWAGWAGTTAPQHMAHERLNEILLGEGRTLTLQFDGPDGCSTKENIFTR